MRHLSSLLGATALSLSFAGMAQAQTFDLNAGQTTTVGTVQVTSAAPDLWIAIDITDPDWILLSRAVEVQCSVGDIPQTKKGNPIPGHFSEKASFNPLDEVIDDDIHLTLPSACDGEGETVVIAVHTTVANIGDQACLGVQQVLSSESSTQVTEAYGDTTGTPRNSTEQFPKPWNDSVSSDLDIDLETDFGAQFVWDGEGNAGDQPVGAVSFAHTYSCSPGTVIVDDGSSNSLQIGCDNEYEAFLNGTSVGSDSDWPTVETLDLSGNLASPVNTFEIDAVNGGSDPNPAMCIYVVDVLCSSCIETGWGMDNFFSAGRGGGNGGPKRNWANYIEHTVED